MRYQLSFKPGHASWWNSDANSRLPSLMQLLFSFDQSMRVDETLMQTLACQLSCSSCSRLTSTWELMKLSCKLSLVNSHAALVLVGPGLESWWNSRFQLPSTIMLVLRLDQYLSHGSCDKKLDLRTSFTQKFRSIFKTVDGHVVYLKIRYTSSSFAILWGIIDGRSWKLPLEFDRLQLLCHLYQPLILGQPARKTHDECVK